jgi:hypothetical protein
MSLSSQSPNQVSDAIDQLFTTELSPHEAELKQFFDRIREKYDESIRATTKYFVLVLFTWVVTVGIAFNFITEIAWLGLTLDAKMLVISPFLIGMLTYLLLSSMAASVILWEAVSNSIRYTLPSAWDLGLECLLAPPTFSNIERMLEPARPSKLSVLWFALITFLMFVGTMGALFSSAYLALRSVDGIWRTVLCFLSALLGLILLLRGLSLSTKAIRATGGFAMRHHRGDAAQRTKHWLN